MAVHKNVPFTASFSITFGPQNINLVGNIHLMGPVILLDIKNYKFVGGRPGRVVIGDDLCSRGQGFESWHHILDGLTLFTIDLLWTLYGLFEKTENKQKEVGVGPFKKNNFKFAISRQKMTMFSGSDNLRQKRLQNFGPKFGQHSIDKIGKKNLSWLKMRRKFWPETEC